MNLTRRTFIGSVAAVTASLSLNRMFAQETASESKSKLGDQREAFDAEYGTGVEADGFIGYLTDRDDVAHYYVAFNDDGIAEAIEIDFKHLPGGGLSTEEATLGTSRFVRDDATGDAPATLGMYRGDGGNYAVQNWHSPSLASDTGRSGNVIVMDSYGHGDEGPTGGTVVYHTMLSMEAFEVNTLTPQHDPMKTSMAWYDPAGPNPTGTATDTQWGWLILDEPAIPGQWFMDTASQVILPAPALSTAEANEFVGTQMPEGEIVWTTWLRPGPLGGEGIRVHGITSDATNVVVAQWVIGDESDGEVVKIMMAVPQAQ